MVALLGACSPVVTHHGDAPAPEVLSALVPGQDGPNEVLAVLGPPTARGALGPPHHWYYMHYAMEKRGIRDARPVGEQMVVVTFGADGRLESVSGRAPERVPVAIDTTATPTRGTERTIAQELFGNIGKFRAPGQSGPI